MRFGDRLSSAVLCCVVVVLVLVGPLTDASAQHSDGWPEIVFVKSLGSVLQLYGVMADGSEPDRLYPWPDDANYTLPVWSPDRRTIAYSYEYGEAIYALDLVTGEERLLLANPSGYWQIIPVQWSPDGSRFLVHGRRGYDGQGVTRIWVVDADGQNATCLSDPEAGYSDFEPRWMPDGQKIVFGSNRDDPFTAPGENIWTMNPDGSGVTRITDSTEINSRPRPSPDGKSIAFVIGYAPSHANIYIMDADGSNITQLTSATGSAVPIGDPWSPDGQRLLFRQRGNIVPTYQQIYVINRDGSGETCLSPPATEEVPRGWSPEGDRIVFESSDENVWVMNADGSGCVNISQGVASFPTWRAEGIRRVYLPFLDVTPDTNITVPVNVDTCFGVAGMQIELTYDPDILECTDVVKGPLLPGSWAMLSPNIDNVVGNVKFLAYDAGAEPLPPGYGEMFSMSFHVKATAPCCTTSPLHFVKCLISDEWGDPILMTAVDGAVTTPPEQCDLALLGSNGSVEVEGVPHSLPWTGSVPCGTEVSLLAVPDSGYVFSGWSGDLTTTDNPAYLVVDESKTVTAEFASELCSLTILGANGSIVVDGFPHALPWSADFTCGTEVTVEAVAASCYAFEGWSGDVMGTVNPVVIAVDGDLIVTAGFGLVAYTLSLDKTGSGLIATDGEPRALPWSGPYTCGTSVDLEAVPQGEHWVFDQWSGDLTGSTNPTILLMNSPKSVTANFLEHVISLSCSAAPDTVFSGGTTLLEAIAADSIGHSMSTHWEDLLDLGPDPVSAMGTFSPSPDVANPSYTAPENPGDQDLPVYLQVTATCDGDPSLIETASCTLTVKPCAVMQAVSSEGTRGEVARVPVVLNLCTSEADRFSFTAAVTPTGAAPALTESLGFEAAAGLPPPGLVSPSGNQVSVAWLSPLTEPVSGIVPLGDVLVPVPVGADLGDLYSVCLTVVGGSLGPDEICVEASECATLFACVEILVGDCYRYDPPMADGNSDGDTCDWGEYNDDALTWGDIITTFDAWTIPGLFTCGTGSHRFYAMDSYPRDGEPGIGGDGTLSWGDIITTFDRWTGMLGIAWRPVCWVGELEVTSQPQVAAGSGRAAAVPEAPSIQLADVFGEAGGTVRMPVVLELHAYQADRLGFSVEVSSQETAAPELPIGGFEAAPGIPQPLVISRPDGSLAVAWMTPIEPALNGAVTVGELIFDLPRDISEAASWTVSAATAGASLGESELDAAVSIDDSATVTVSPAPLHDVGIARFRVPRSARAGSTRTFSIVVENLTKTAESVVVRLRRRGQVVGEWPLELAAGDSRRLRTDYRFTSEDIPQVEFTAEVVAPADDHPENNTDVKQVRVR